jgi:tetratricopeptide (TPR) repeat protein
VEIAPGRLPGRHIPLTDAARMETLLVRIVRLQQLPTPLSAVEARTLLHLGRALAAAGRHADALERFDAAAGCADADRAVVAQAQAEAGTLGLLDPARRAALLHGLPSANGGTADAGHRALTAMRCVHRTLAGAPRADILALARAAADGDGAFVEHDAGSTVLIATSVALQACDELLWSEREMTAALDRARAAGSTVAFATASLARAGSRWAQGRLVEALADAEQALDAQRYGWRHLLPCAYGTVVGLLVDRGELAAAAATAARHDASASGYAGSALLAPWHEALGRLALAERREADALAHFEAWRDVVSDVANPACGAGWRSASVPALVSLGRSDEARVLALEELERTRAFGAARAICGALRALAQAEAHGAIEDQIALLEEAVGLAAASKARLELCAPSSSSAWCCAGHDDAPTPAACSATHSCSPGPAARGSSRSACSRSSRSRGRAYSAPRDAAPTRSAPASAASSGSRSTGCPTGRSPRPCLSRARPSSGTSATRIASSTCAPGTSCRAC